MKKKFFIALFIISTTTLFLTACTSKKEATLPTFNSKRPLRMWVGLNQGKFYRALVKDFEKKEGVKVEVVEQEEADDGLLKDAESAADVAWVQNDQLGQLVKAGTLYENEKYATVTKTENSEISVRGASYDGKLYGYPTNISSMYLFYDKRVFKQNDLLTLDSMLAKGKVGLNIAEAGADYRLTPWFISNGSYLYGKSGNDLNGSTLNNQKGVDVLNYIANLKNQKNLIALNADEISALKEGKIQALFSGNWNLATIKKILGDNMGCVAYPSTNFGDGEVKLKAFISIPIFVVNSASQNPSKAMSLANYVSNKEAQVKQYKVIGGVPSNIEAFKSKEVQSDESSRTVGQMANQQGVLMPSLPEMKNFWSNMNAIIVDAYSGNISKNKMKPVLNKLVEDTSKPVE